MRLGDRHALADALIRARRLTLSFFANAGTALPEVPCLPTLNPPLWELGHVGWFQEYWCLRWPLPARRGPVADVSLAPSALPSADAWYDSSRIAHDSRWSLPLPSLAQTRDYLERTLRASLEKLAAADDSDDALYFFRLALFHECMHAEAFACTWQTLGWPAPDPDWVIGPVEGIGRDLVLPAGSVRIGREGPGFSHDNEQPATEVPVQAGRIAAAPVTHGEYLAFVEDGGYRDPRWWEAPVFAALAGEGRQAPRHWQQPGDWRLRWFDRQLPLPLAAPVVHVDAHEAQAYCRWAGGHLPTEAQWVQAATRLPGFQWGRHVWEWTATDFLPLPGFAPGPYRDYSEPWFGDHRVVRGASFVTPRDMADTQFRNFYRPGRSDLFVGFRVCR
jgi:ergothioneine biosynthesis protein EgtB